MQRKYELLQAPNFKGDNSGDRSFNTSVILTGNVLNVVIYGYMDCEKWNSKYI